MPRLHQMPMSRRRLILASKVAALLRFLLWIAALLFYVVPAQAALTFPALTGRVVDQAQVLPADQVAALDAKLKGIEASTGHQLVVATVADLQGDDIADYGYQLGRFWQIGTKGKNDGALIIVAPKEHKVRIEVGYGLEPIVTDALSSVIIRNNMTPSFKGGDYAGGINAGVDALSEIIKLPPEEAAARAKALVAAQGKAGGQKAVGIGQLLPLLFFLLFFVVPMFRRRGAGGGVGSGLGQVMLWSALSNMGGRDSGGSSWGGGDGGGFSGGGGSFGGGGSSGSW